MQNELNELRNNVDRSDQSYFNGGNRPVDDSVYDSWKRRLKELAPYDERLTRIGAPIGNAGVGKKAKHVHPMGSLDNAMNEEEFLKWAASHPEGTLYNVSFKMDGGSAALIYKDGNLVQAITRGDGSEGEDITANALQMQGVPRYVEIPGMPPPVYELGKRPEGIEKGWSKKFTGSVRGEIMLFNEDWKTLDPDQLSNPRNLGNGMSRRHDGEDTEKLRFVAFRGFDADGKPLGDQEFIGLNMLDKLGFQTVWRRDALSAKGVIDLYKFMQSGSTDSIFWGLTPARDNLPFEIDGLVVKVEDLELQESLGVTNNRPKGQIAFKFPPRGALTELTGIEWTVGHTGALIPTGLLNPVKIGGVTVSRALLCNMEEIERLGVAIGDIVRVIRAGDVIPKIVAVADQAKNDRQQIHAPATCPVCGGVVGKKKGVTGDDSVHLFCLNPDCGAKQIGKIKTWVKKLDIQGLGDVYLQALYEAWVEVAPGSKDRVAQCSGKRRVLGTPADLYKLRDRGFEYFERDGETAISPKVATKILAEIDKKRNLTLAEFLGSLGIDGLGRRRVILVQQAAPGEFDALSDWCNGKLVEMATEIGLPNTAERIHDAIMASKKLIDQLLEAGVTIKEEKTMSQEKPKEGQLTFVLTGKGPEKKEFYHDAIAAAGHVFSETYSKATSYLVAADPNSGSSKMKKAAKDGVPVITHEQLLEMLK